ncbi:MAG: hypothetical protein JWP40_4779 [Blastococcus sp.]|nr:hypothetical protein [Blastococcus sp.]
MTLSTAIDDINTHHVHLFLSVPLFTHITSSYCRAPSSSSYSLLITRLTNRSNIEGGVRGGEMEGEGGEGMIEGGGGGEGRVGGRGRELAEEGGEGRVEGGGGVGEGRKRSRRGRELIGWRGEKEGGRV